MHPRSKALLGFAGVSAISLFLAAQTSSGLSYMDSYASAGGLAAINHALKSYQHKGAVLGASTPDLLSHNSHQSFTPTASAAYPLANASGDLLIVTVETTDISAALSVTDSNNNPYSLVRTFVSGNILFGMFDASNCAGGSNIVTATASGSANTSISISEFSGMGTNVSLDSSSGAAGFGGNPTTVLTLSASGDLVYAYTYLANGQTNVGSGFTAINGGYPGYGGDEYQIQAGSGSAAASFSNGNPSSGTWIIIGAAFKPGGLMSGTTPTPVPTPTPTPTPMPTPAPAPAPSPAPSPAPVAGTSQFPIGWTDLPNTSLQSVCPPNGFGPEVSDGKPYNFAANCPYVINAWGDAIGDTIHNRMIIWGGGHSDYAGNEIYQLDLGAKTMTRLNDPSLPAYDRNAGCGAISSSSYPYQANPSDENNWAMQDGRPNTRHTQGQEVYIPSIDSMFTNNGGVACGNGLHYGDTWLLNLGNITNTGTSGWTQMDPTNGTKIFNGTSADGGGLGSWWSVNAYDPNSDSVISETNDMLLSYNYHTNTYTTLKSYGTIHLPVAANRTIDTKRKLMITWGAEWPFGPEANSNVYVKTISLVAPFTVTDITAQVMNSSSGCTPWITAPTLSNPTSYYPWFFPGMAYDPVIDRTVLWPNTGSTVYLFNPDTNTCIAQTLSGTPPTVSNMIEGNGTIGRFQYFPSLDAFGLVADPSQDGYVLKINNSGLVSPTPTPAPTPTPTPTPTPIPTPPPSQVSGSLDGVKSDGTIFGWAEDQSNLTQPIYVHLYFDNNAGTAGASAVAVLAGDSRSDVGAHAFNYVLPANSPLRDSNPHRVWAWGISLTDTSGASNIQLPGSPATFTFAPPTITPTPTPTPTPPTAGASLNGLGASTLTCIDPLGKGYGVGPGCLGPDADEFDPTVHTGAQAIAKWGSLNAFLAHLGYTPTNIWYLSPTGVDASTNGVPNCKNNINAPCLTYSFINGLPQAGDMLMLRDKWSGRLNIPSGTAGHPFYVMSYPGEQADLDGTANFLDTSDRSYLIIDGLKLSGGAYIAAGTIAGFPDPKVITFHDNIFRHIDAVGPFSGLGGFYGFTMANVTVEDSAFHDNHGPSAQHGIYSGSRTTPSTNVIFQRLLLYHNDWNGIHWNGQCTGCMLQDVVSYNNGITGLDFEMGWNHSVIQDNLSFNNGKQLIFYDYPGQCPQQNTHPDANTVYICPYDENYNVIENNTLYGTGNNTIDPPGAQAGCPTNYPDCNSPVDIRNVTNPPTGNFDHDIFRNNIIIAQGNSNNNPPLYYSNVVNGVDGCDATCMSWLSTTTFNNNLFYQVGSGSGDRVLRADNFYNCSAASAVTTVTNCLNADPKFVSASPSLWNSADSFDFHLQSASPAIDAGTTAGAPQYDIVGNNFNNPPSIGAYEYAAGSPTPTPTPTPSPSPSPTPTPTPTPTPPPVDQSPIGHLDGVKSDGTVYGWSQDPDNLSVPNQVHIYVDKNAGTTGASPLAAVTASDYRSDVGNHAFNFILPSQYQDGQPHKVWVWGIDLTDTTGAHNVQLPGSPVSFTLAEPTPTPSPTPTPNPSPSPTPSIVHLLLNLEGVPAGHAAVSNIALEVLDPNTSQLITSATTTSAQDGSLSLDVSDITIPMINIRVIVPGYLSIIVHNINLSNLSSPITTPQLLAGDLNGDGIINALDYSLLSKYWNQVVSGANSLYDLNKDGVVNSYDSSLLTSNWLKTGE